MNQIPTIIQGGSHTDERGTLIFFNDFDMKPIRRFYQTEHPDVAIIRAWQGHKTEQKWFTVLEGSFKIVLVKPTEWLQAGEAQHEPKVYNLIKGDNKILHIPGGFANGFQALVPNSRLMIFSDFEFEKAGSDDFRFDKDLWYDWK